MSQEKQTKTAIREQLEESRIRVRDGDPVLELPDGTRIRLGVHVKEWTHEEPEHGESVEMAVEVDADDFAWWTLYPERSDVSRVTTEEDFPEITITAKIEGVEDE